MLFQDGRFQWRRLENLLSLAQQGGGGGGGLDLSDTVASGARVVLADDRLRTQLLLALTEDNRLHIDVRAPGPLPAHAARSRRDLNFYLNLNFWACAAAHDLQALSQTPSLQTNIFIGLEHVWLECGVHIMCMCARA